MTGQNPSHLPKKSRTTFAAVIDMIWTFHNIKRPATTAPSRTATAFDQMRGLQNDPAPGLHLPTSPLLGGLIDDVNATLARLIKEQSNGFIPFPMRQYRRFYRTATPSLPGPYAVLPSLTSLTLEKSSDHKQRPILLPHTVLAGLETALSGLGEAASWMDWWLSTVSGFRKALHPSDQANFERLLSSGLKTLAFMGSQTVPTLANLMLSRRNSLTAEVKSTVPTEELSLLRHSLLPTSTAIFPSALLDTALNKARATPMMPLSIRPCTSPAFPSDSRRATTSPPPPTGRGDRSGSSPLTPHQQQTPRSTNQGPLQTGSKSNMARKSRRPFSQPTGRSSNSSGKGKGSRKLSTRLYPHLLCV